jgi:hypothetical protein
MNEWPSSNERIREIGRILKLIREHGWNVVKFSAASSSSHLEIF